MRPRMIFARTSCFRLSRRRHWPSSSLLRCQLRCQLRFAALMFAHDHENSSKPALSAYYWTLPCWRVYKQNFTTAAVPPIPGSMHAFIDSHRTTQGTGGQLGIIPEQLVEDMPLLGLFFPPSSCLTTLATRAPSRVFCHAVTAYAHYRAPFSCGWDLKFCFAVGKDLFLGLHMVFNPSNSP